MMALCNLGIRPLVFLSCNQWVTLQSFNICLDESFVKRFKRDYAKLDHGSI